MFILLGPYLGNFLRIEKTPYKEAIVDQIKQTQWTLKNLERSEKVAISKHGCPAYVFQGDIRYFKKPGYRESKFAQKDLGTTDLFEAIERYNPEYFFIYPSELEWSPPKLKEFLHENYEMLPLVKNYGHNCVWKRKES